VLKNYQDNITRNIKPNEMSVVLGMRDEEQGARTNFTSRSPTYNVASSFLHDISLMTKNFILVVPLMAKSNT